MTPGPELNDGRGSVRSNVAVDIFELGGPRCEPLFVWIDYVIGERLPKNCRAPGRLGKSAEQALESARSARREGSDRVEASLARLDGIAAGLKSLQRAFR